MPPLSAGLSGCTSLTSAPRTCEAEAARDVGRDRLDRHAEHAAADLPLSISCVMTLRAMFAGIEKPIPMLPPDGDRICELMPISSPSVLTSAPPELPWLIGASVWMKSSKLPSPRRRWPGPSRSRCPSSRSGRLRADCRPPARRRRPRTASELPSVSVVQVVRRRSSPPPGRSVHRSRPPSP